MLSISIIIIIIMTQKTIHVFKPFTSMTGVSEDLLEIQDFIYYAESRCRTILLAIEKQGEAEWKYHQWLQLCLRQELVSI
jgi:hypothetical protein